MLPLSAINASEPNQELWRSIQAKNTKRFEAALSAGANPREKDSIGQSSLHQVVTFWGDLAVIEKLLATGVDLNATDADGATPLLRCLHYAHYSNDRSQLERVVTLLLSKGAHANVADKKGRLPISKALELGHLPLIEALIGAGARLPRDALLKTLSFTPANVAVINFLMKHAADLDLNLRNEFGQTVLYQAAKDERLLFLLQWLVERGADLQALDNNGASLLYPAALNNNRAGLIYLYERGLKLDSADRDKQQAIHLNAQAGQYTTLQWLIERGADLQAQDRWGRRALDIVIESHTFTFASDRDRQALVALLGGNERDIARGRFRRHPVNMAVLAENLDEVERLLKAGENVNVKDESGRTPLARAIELFTGNLATPRQIEFGRKLLPLLVKYGADTTIRMPITLITYDEYANQLGIGAELVRLKQRYAPRAG